MNVPFGTEVETTFLDDNGSTVELIRTFKESDVTSQFKRISLRIRVKDKQDETTQYLIFSDLIEQKKREGVLVYRDSDPTTRPSFVIEYPRKDADFYTIVRTFTELMV